MASTKRKRLSTRSKTPKRPKYADSSDSENAFWEAEAILGERRHHGQRQFKIKWKGRDPATGKDYDPTWEPEDNPNQLLLDAWEEERAAATSSAQAQRQARARSSQRRPPVVESSPEPSTAAPESAAHEPWTTTPVCASPPPERPSPRIQIGARGSSFEPHDFERYSQLAPTQAAPAITPRHTPPHPSQDTEPDSSQLFTAEPPFGSGVVPDSQSSAGEASFLPATQITGDSSTASTLPGASQADQATQDSGLLEIINQAASRAASPVLSGAETVPDIIADSQSEPQPAALEFSREIPDTFETVESSSRVPNPVGEDVWPDPIHVSQDQHTIAAEVLQNDAEQVILQGTPPSNPNPDSQHIAVNEIISVPQPQSADSAREHTEVTNSTEHFTPEEYAQVVSTESIFTTQEDSLDSIRPTIEKEDSPDHASRGSRHDSSQEQVEESARERLRSEVNSSSPVAGPPNLSLGPVNSVPPPRPFTPTPDSSTMAGHESGEDIAKQLKERLKRSEKKFTPDPNRLKRGPLSLSPASASKVAGTPTAARRLLGMDATPSRGTAEGTRSPSMVPDHSPAPQVPTSLRTVAFAPVTPEVILDDGETALRAAEESEVAIGEVNTSGEEAAVPSEILMATDREDEELSDADADDDESMESLLTDNLDLAEGEYIVPLFTEGRQSAMYSDHLKQKKDILKKFLESPHEFSPLSPIEDVLSELKLIETHIDMVYAEAETDPDLQTASQFDFAAEFGVENAVKFRFLHTLFNSLMVHEKHVLLVVEEDNDKLFSIIETFCKAKFYNYSMPTKGRQVEPMRYEGSLSLTILPSEASAVIKAPDLIVCLDGVQHAAHIRQKSWAQSTEQLVPILHLVIPRTVGHIERYLTSALDHRDRLHTIFASLAQLRLELGKPLDETTHRATDAAILVADWLVKRDDAPEWPLLSIGSVNDVVEYQTQVSQTSQKSRLSTPSPALERTKRPLESESLASQKRMRFTPQPQIVSSSIPNIEHDGTHVSDSMPGTAEDAANIQMQLRMLQEALQKEIAARESDRQRFREHEEAWSRQQLEHENRAQEYRQLFDEKKSVDEKLETLTRNHETVRERLNKAISESRNLTEQLAAQRATGILDSDEKVVEITRLRKELASVQADRDSAINNGKSIQSTHDYLKEQYHNASNAAVESQAKVDEMTATIATLERRLSDNPAKLRSDFNEKHTRNLEKKVKLQESQRQNLNAIVKQREEEIRQLKAAPMRQGVGTRGQSATPQPTRVRSRAASPNGSRISNLRNGKAPGDR